MDLPEDIKLRQILTQGGAFKAVLEENHDSYSRYYFVLNLSPESDEVILLSTSTTDFFAHSNCDGDEKVHLPLSKSDYDSFTEHCLICCNRPVLIPKESLKIQLSSQKYEILPALPQEILDRILNGIASSKIVPTKTKRLVLGNI